jgi:hypothetical protein
MDGRESWTHEIHKSHERGSGGESELLTGNKKRPRGGGECDIWAIRTRL